MIHSQDPGADSETVVLVHSSAASGRQWRTLSELLTPRYSVNAPDLGGYGRTPETGAHLSYEDDCARIRQLVTAAANPVHLVGHSYGGLIAARIAFEDPDRLRSLTLIEPVCFHLLREAGELAAFEEICAVRDRQIAAVERGDLTASAAGFIEYWMGAEAWTAMPTERREAVAKVMPKVMVEWPGAFESTTRLDQYAALPWPTQIIRAADTTLAAGTVVDLIVKQNPDIGLVEVAAGGHMSPVTNPAPVNDAIVAFLES